MISDDIRRGADRACMAALADGVPGIAAIVCDPRDTVYENAFGFRNDAGDPMTTDTVMDIASMTKPITAAAAMQLVEQGRLDLDAPAARYVPAIDALKVLDRWDGETPIMRAPSRALTLRHLMTHTAGMGYDVWSRDTGRFNARHSIPSVNTGDPRSLSVALMNDPGDAWLYGTSMDWVSRIVAEVSGQSFGSYLEEHILAPLGMHDTSYQLTSAMRRRLARISVRSDDGDFVQTDRERRQSPPVEFGGAGLYSTARDYIRFVRLFLNRGSLGGVRVLQPRTVELMTRNAMGPVRVVSLKSHNPAFARDLALFPEAEQTWGLSFHITETSTRTGRAPGSLSWAGIFNTYFWIDIKSEIGGVLMTQTTPFLDPRVRQLYTTFESAVYEANR